MSSIAHRFRVTAAGVVVLATAAAGALAPSPAHAAARAVSESYQVPANGTVSVTGHGFGHGRGMSQYGAQGAAKQGLDHRRILAFYYPGTTPATAGGTIRALISADTDNDVRVLPAAGLAVREVASGTSYALPAIAGLKTWRLRTVGANTVLDYDNGAWRAHRTLKGEAEFHGPAALTLRVAGTTRTYRGTLRLSRSDTVNVVSLEDYVRGVVPREMPTSWAPAAVQAQAVAARTYAARDRADNLNRHYQTCDTTSCQVYGGLAAEDARGNAAVAATAGQILAHQGKPAFTQFGSSSGGWLAAGNMPYLVAKADPYDGHSGNPVHTWTKSLTRAAIQKAYPGVGTLQRINVTRRDGNGDWAGRVEQLVLDGSKSNVTLSGTTFRSKFGLRSHWFRFGSGAGAPVASAPVTVPPRQATPAPASPITQRWRALGGNRSVLGKPKGPEYAVPGGRARNFKKGRIYAKNGVAPRELRGKFVKVYARRGGPARLGFPVTSQQRVGKRLQVRFERAVMSVKKNGKGKVRVVLTR